MQPDIHMHTILSNYFHIQTLSHKTQGICLSLFIFQLLVISSVCKGTHQRILTISHILTHRLFWNRVYEFSCVRDMYSKAYILPIVLELISTMIHSWELLLISQRMNTFESDM